MDEYTRPCAPWTWTDSIELIEAFGFCSEWPRETESAEYECGFMYMDDIENEVTIAIEGVSYPEALDAFCFESEGVIEADTFEEFLMDPDFAEIVATHKLLTY